MRPAEFTEKLKLLQRQTAGYNKTQTKTELLLEAQIQTKREI